MNLKCKLLTLALPIAMTLSISTTFAQYLENGRTNIDGLQRPKTSPRLSTHDYFGSMWSTLSPEQKFGAFIEGFWAFARENTGSVNCYPDERDHKACLARQGYTFEVSYPNECVVVFSEQFPPPTNVQKTWDGQVVGKYQVAHRLTLNLRSLRRDLINNSLKLYFDESSPKNVRIEVKLTSNPNEWAAIPNPPTLKDIPQGQSEEDRLAAAKQNRLRWGGEVIHQFGSGGHLPYFSHFYPTPEAYGAPPQLLDANYAFYALTPPNRMQPVSLFSPNSAGNADALFVDALKSVIAKCPQQ